MFRAIQVENANLEESNTHSLWGVDCYAKFSGGVESVQGTERNRTKSLTASSIRAVACGSTHPVLPRNEFAASIGMPIRSKSANSIQK